MEIADFLNDLPVRAKGAVARCWITRAAQANKQKLSGTSDEGNRGAAARGARMDGLLDIPAHYPPRQKADTLNIKKAIESAMEEKTNPKSGNN